MTKISQPTGDATLYTPGHIANYMLSRSEKEYIPLTVLKLLKLVYISYGWALAVFDKKLFDEPFQAWEHGPVIPSLYHEFKHNKKYRIEDFAVNFCWDDQSTYIPKVDKKDKDTHTILEIVWDIYKDLSAWNLRNKTHEEDSPWDRAIQKGKYAPLDDGDIKEHFTKKIRFYLDHVIS